MHEERIINSFKFIRAFVAKDLRFLITPLPPPLLNFQ